MDPGLSNISVSSKKSGDAVLEVAAAGKQQQQGPGHATPQQAQLTRRSWGGFLSHLPDRKQVVRQVSTPAAGPLHARALDEHTQLLTRIRTPVVLL